MANGEITVNVTGLDEYKETLKYAEEAGAACEEMKHDIEQVIREIKGGIKTYASIINPTLHQSGYLRALERAEIILNENLVQYLDPEE